MSIEEEIARSKNIAEVTKFYQIIKNAMTLINVKKEVILGAGAKLASNPEYINIATASEQAEISAIVDAMESLN